MDLQVPQERLDQLVTGVYQVTQACLVKLVCLVKQENLGREDSQDQEERQVPKDHQVSKDFLVNVVFLDHLERMVEKVKEVQLDLLVHMEIRVNKVWLDLQEVKVPWGDLALKEKLVLKVQREILVNLVSLVLQVEMVSQEEEACLDHQDL